MLNEVLYDPPGADGGREFVEIWNGGEQHTDMAGVVLEFGNGSAPGIWEVRWRGTMGEQLAPGARLLIVDRGWSGEATPDAEVSLGLQNGPDAVRLVRDGVVLDLLGYGPLDSPDLYETRPHPGAPGHALARRPDGRDTDRNDEDWHAVGEPTPGEPNVLPLALTVTGWTMEPPTAVAGVEALVVVGVENDGLLPWPSSQIRLLADGITAATVVWDGVDPADGVELAVPWIPQHDATPSLALAIPRPDSGVVELSLGRVLVGVPPVTLEEVMAAPERGAPEWVELSARDGDVILDGWTLEDDGGERRDLPDRILAMGERLVLTADPEAFAAWVRRTAEAGAPWPCGGTDPLLVSAAPGGGWPTLNNTAGDGADRADRLVLRDGQGTAVDWVSWGGLYPPAPPGRSLERVSPAPTGLPDLNWTPSTSPAGSTPACPNAVAATGAPGDGLDASPMPFGAEGVAVRFRLRAGEEAWDLSVLDLDGRLVRDLGDDDLGPGPRSVPWDGLDDRGAAVPAGPLLLLLRLRDGRGVVVRRETAVVVRREEGA